MPVEEWESHGGFDSTYDEDLDYDGGGLGDHDNETNPDAYDDE